MEMDMYESATTHKLGYRIREFCDAAGIGRTKTYALIAEGRLHAVRIGRCTIITADSARALLGLGATGHHAQPASKASNPTSEDNPQSGGRTDG
jgi:excisionase family DNA binding protein